MEKATIELNRIPDNIKGYGSLRSFTGGERQIMDVIVDWSKKNPDKKVYEHRLYNQEENYNYEVTYNPSKSTWVKGLENIELPTCDLVQYLDIYYQ